MNRRLWVPQPLLTGIPASPFDRVPAELTLQILQIVRASLNFDEVNDFVACLQCCKIWLELGKPIHWKDVVLQNDTFVEMVPKMSIQSSYIKSVTVQISPVKLASRAGQPPSRFDGSRGEIVLEPEDASPDDVLPSQQNHGVWVGLERLAGILGSMESLLSFSLVVSPRVSQFHPWNFWLNRGTLIRIISDLPQTCVHLELDIAGLNEIAARRHCLCQAIGGILPRLQTLKLRVDSLCPLLFNQKEQNLDLSLEPTDRTRFSYAPFLKMVVINLIRASDERGWGLTSTYLCPPSWSGAAKAPRYRSSFASKTILSLAQEAFRSGCFPNINRFSFLEYTPILDEQLVGSLYGTVSPTFFDHDIARDQTSKIPFASIDRGSSWIVRLNSPFQDDLLDHSVKPAVLRVRSRVIGHFPIRYNPFYQHTVHFDEILRQVEGSAFQETNFRSRLPVCLINHAYVIPSLHGQAQHFWDRIPFWQGATHDVGTRFEKVYFGRRMHGGMRGGISIGVMNGAEVVASALDQELVEVKTVENAVMKFTVEMQDPLLPLLWGFQP